MKLFPIIVALTLILVFGACKKTQEDLTPPFITILSPSEGARTTFSDSISIEAFIEDEELSRVTVLLRQFNGTAPCCPVLNESSSPATSSFRYNTVLAPQASGPYLLTVSAVDLAGNESEVQLGFTVE
jgi:Bacterial Ig domain